MKHNIAAIVVASIGLGFVLGAATATVIFLTSKP